jgi:hypothetical protein
MEGGAAGYSFERGPSKDHYSQVFWFNLVKRIYISYWNELNFE